MTGPLERLARAVYRGLLPARVKNSLRLRLLFDERDKPPRIVERFDDGPVLAIAPHMDDEVVGCGGALRRHVLAGARVTVVFLTDGARGNAELAPEPGLPERRRAESRRAAEILGTHELVFLDRPDGALEADDALAGELAGLLARTRPALVYLPSLLDTHEDHWVSCLALRAALERGDLRPRLRQYEVWSPLIANAVVDLTPVLQEKRRALEQFESQLPHLDLVRLALGLGQYRSIHLDGGRGHAEAFFESDEDAFRSLLARAEVRS